MKSPKVVDKTFYDLLSENAALAKIRFLRGTGTFPASRTPGWPS